MVETSNSYSVSSPYSTCTQYYLEWHITGECKLITPIKAICPTVFHVCSIVGSD